MDNADPEDMELELDLEPEPDPPTTQAAGDPAAEAFARLEGELALMRRAVQHLAAERADIVIPDYRTTLTEMVKWLGKIDKCLKNMAEHPAMQMTPDSIGDRIAAVAETARRTEQDRVSQARNDLHHAAQALRSVTEHARAVADQRQQLLKVAGGSLLAGILLWSFLPGSIARSMPESWHWPERMAARMVGAPSVLEAGIRLIRSQNPEAWAVMLDTERLERENREVLKRCKAKAARDRHSVDCSLRVGN
jgi:cell division septum initiation protein DivIVA